MGWTDQETVALVGGGHTLGRAHGNCPNAGMFDSCVSSLHKQPAAAVIPGPFLTARLDCQNGAFTTTAGYEGIWTRTPSKWNYDYFTSLEEEWIPTKSPEGNDQWGTKVPFPSFLSF